MELAHLVPKYISPIISRVMVDYPVDVFHLSNGIKVIITALVIHQRSMLLIQNKTEFVSFALLTYLQ